MFGFAPASSGYGFAASEKSHLILGGAAVHRRCDNWHGFQSLRILDALVVLSNKKWRSTLSSCATMRSKSDPGWGEAE